mgnify:CR=1 FL=1
MVPTSYQVDRGSGFGGDKKKYAHEIVWFGRKGGKYFYPLSKKESPSIKNNDMVSISHS